MANPDKSHLTITVSRPAHEKTVRLVTEETIITEEEFSDPQIAQDHLDLRETSIPLYLTRAAAAVVTVYSAAEVLQAVQDTPSRTTHALLATFAAGTALYLKERIKGSKKRTEYAPLQSKALDTARRRGFTNGPQVFPLDHPSRILTAITSIEEEGGIPTFDNLERRDVELRSTHPDLTQPLAYDEISVALDRLTEEGVIISNMEEIPDAPPNHPNSLLTYRRVEPTEEAKQ